MLTKLLDILRAERRDKGFVPGRTLEAEGHPVEWSGRELGLATGGNF